MEQRRRPTLCQVKRIHEKKRRQRRIGARKNPSKALDDAEGRGRVGSRDSKARKIDSAVSEQEKTPSKEVDDAEGRGRVGSRDSAERK